jgi:hypothetical protein
MRIEVRGQLVAPHRYSLCWAAIERYEPHTAEDLARLRESREQRKTQLEEKRWAEANPLLSWAERQQRDNSVPGWMQLTRFQGLCDRNFSWRRDGVRQGEHQIIFIENNFICSPKVPGWGKWDNGEAMHTEPRSRMDYTAIPMMLL